MKSLRTWLSEAGHLPAAFRDFHDQKDLFKTIWRDVTEARKKDDLYLKDMNWVSSHVFVIDFFLRFMAQHGYTLQRYRGEKPEDGFYDLDTTIREMKDEESKTFQSFFQSIEVEVPSQAKEES